MNLGIVCERDPARHCSLPVGVVHPIDPERTFLIGRDRACDVVVEDRSVNRRNCGVDRRGASWVLTDYRGPNGVTVNGARVDDTHAIEAGDVVSYPGGCVLRFVVVDALAHVARVDRWIALGVTRVTTPQATPAFSVEGGLRRGWLVSTPADDRDVALWARTAGQRAALPAVVDSFVGRKSVHRVFDVADFVDVLRFARRAAPASSSLVVRIGLDVARALATVFDDAHRAVRAVRVGVTFDGRVVVLPGPAPFHAEGVGHLEAAADPAGRDVDTTPLVEILAALQPQHAPLRALAWPERWRLPFHTLDEGLRSVGHKVGVAGDDEVRAVVRGLFADDHRAAVQLHEQLETLDAAAVERLLRNASKNT